VVVLLLGAVVYYSIPAVLSTEAASGNPWEHSQIMASRQNPVDDRMDKMAEGMKMFRESPIWGQGIGYFQWKRQSPAIIHNTLVWFLVEMGLIGLGVFIWFIIGHLRRAVFNVRRSVESARPTSIGLLCGFVALTGLSAGIEALNQRHWWLIMALISAAWLLTKNEGVVSARGPQERRPVVQ
jgi:putative inorganic carbon (HCO3(-)) transporter